MSELGWLEKQEPTLSRGGKKVSNLINFIVFEQKWLGNLPLRAILVNFLFKTSFFTVFEQKWLGNLPLRAMETNFSFKI